MPGQKMPKRDEKGWEHERAAFDADMAAARAALDAWDLAGAVKLAISPAHKYWYGKEPERFELLRDLYNLISSPLEESVYRETPWLPKLMAELYSVWPKVSIECAILRHDFPEIDVSAREQLLGTLDIDNETYERVRRQIHETKVSGPESVQFARYSSGFLTEADGLLSRGRTWLKFWDLETGEMIHATERGLSILASSISRDGSHVFYSYWWYNSETKEICWSTSRIETYRKVRLARAGTYEKSHYENAKYYKLSGQITLLRPEETLEVDLKEFEANPIRGERLRPREFERQHSPRYREIIQECNSPEEAARILENDRLEEEREAQIVRLQKYQTVTIDHDEIEGYLPAQTTTFVAKDGFAERLTVSHILGAERITARLGVEDGESWLEEIIAPGLGLRSTWTVFSSPITDVCLSSDGSVGLANGLRNSFGVWNLWTGKQLRELRGHTGRVTCLCPSIDVSLVASGSEDKTVRLWTPVTSECVRVLEGHTQTVSKVCVSLDATKVLSADRGGVIKLWDTQTGECLRTIQAHRNNVSGLYLMFDGRFAVSGSWDQTVKIWNLIDGSCIETFEFADWVTSVDMTPDGRYLAASSYEGTKVWELVWRLDPREVVEWDEGARPALKILLNANAAWKGKLGTPIDMTEEEIRESLRRGGPSWTAWHTPSKKDDWYKVWHLNSDIETTMGYAGFGWLSDLGGESEKIQDEWKRKHPD